MTGNTDAAPDDPTLPEYAEALSTGILLHDAETGAILDANEAAADIYGYSTERLQEVGVGEFSSEAPRFSQEAAATRIREAAEQGERTFDWQIKRPNGAVRWVQVTLSTWSRWEDEYVLAEIHDITESKSRDRRLSLLSRIIRHNLRNQMNIVQAHASELERALETDNLEDQAAKILDVAKDAGQMSESVQAIERFASDDSAERSATNLRTVVADIAEDLNERASSTEITVTGDADVIVAGDEGLEMALREALENSVEHSRDAPTDVSVTVRAGTAQPRALVEIVDENPRIPEMDRNAILAHYEGSATDHGSGVGLFVSKWCAESLGGDLEIHANDPSGNRVRFIFPLLDTPADES